MSSYPFLRAPFLTAILASTALGAHDHGPASGKRDLTKGNTLYVVGYAHLDTQWRWAYPQVIREFIPNTLTRNFALIDKYPNYVFNFSGSRRYEMMKEYYPEDYKKLIGYVKAGRWYPCGSSVDENDANVPSAESYVRHVLYGNRFFRKEFGVASSEYMLPDCFGFPYSLPTMLRHCGIDQFSTQKLTWGSAVGIPFKVGTWEGPDGKSVVAALDPGSYGGGVEEDLSQNTSWLARIQNTGKQSGAFVDYHYYGTGDQGGAPRDGSVDWVEKSLAGTGPISVVSAKADELVKSLTPDQVAKLPHYKGELLLTQHSAGSITSQAYMKRWNRKNELLANGAETASVAAMLLGTANYPSKRLYDAWDLVLGSQMHDMLPGTSIPKAYEFCWNDELLASNMFAGVETDAVGAVASQMDTRGVGQALVVYNPLSIARKDVVEASVGGSGTPHVYSPDGHEVPSQSIGQSRIAFLANSPSVGFSAYHVRFSPSKVASTLKVADHTIENERFKVTVNAAGDIASVYDKQAKREVMKAPSRFELQYHNPSAFPAWNMDWDDAKLPPREIVGGPAQVKIVENGPVRVSLEVTRTLGASKFVQKISLTKGGQQVDVDNTIDWQTRERALKVAFPLASGNPEATYDLQVGAIKRGNNDPKKYEVPQHQWLDLTDPKGAYGVGILNDSKFGSDKPDDNTVRLTLIYTPGIRSGFEDQATQDFGRHHILYAIAPHASDWRKGGVAWSAKRLNQPLRAFYATPHKGSLGKSFSLLTTNSRQVEVTAIKKAEDGNNIVVRLRELNGSAAKGVKLTFSSAVKSAREVNGQEMDLGGAKVSGGSLIADVPAYSLKAYSVSLGRKAVSSVASQPLALPFNADVVSTDANRADGAFDALGMSIPAEQLPSTLKVDDVKFQLGSTAVGANNAVAANGQTINLPAGTKKVYILAASSDGDVNAIFKIGSVREFARINAWNGYVGQWDNRTWAADPGKDFSNYGDNMTGLVPGYRKSGEVAWYSSHRHTPTENTYYDYCYLFKSQFVVDGQTTITLPNDPKVKILAMTATGAGHDGVSSASPLYDQFGSNQDKGLATFKVEGAPTDTVHVTIEPPMYHQKGELRYTTDPAAPLSRWKVYEGPIDVSKPTMILAREEHGEPSVIRVEANDVTPPTVVVAASPKALGYVKVQFSEPVDAATAGDPANYKLSSGTRIASVKLWGKTAELTLRAPLKAGESESLTVSSIKDAAGNVNPGQTIEIAEHGAVFTAPALEASTTKSFPVTGLPVKATDSWTLNLWCMADKMPEDRTIIGGFGRSVDGRAGTGRYFTKFPAGINFWVSTRDVRTTIPLDLGKWQMLTAVYDGTTMRVYKNGKQIAEEAVKLEDDQSVARAMPLDAWERKRRFDGQVSAFTIWDVNLSPEAVKRLWEAGHN